MEANTKELNRYLAEIDKIYRVGNATEHSYRPALKSLFENITEGLTITNEPKRIECGAPDYIITRGGVPLGYIEAKDIKAGINNKLNKEQFDRYKRSLGNLIITDYLTFQLFIEGELLVSVTVANENSGAIVSDKKQFDAFTELVTKFIGYEGKTIANSAMLADMMAAKARLLAEIIEKALHDTDAENDTLSGQLEGFRKILIHDLSTPAFADMYAQTLVYGMFAARLNAQAPAVFSRQAAANLIPQSNPFLRKFFQYVAGFDLDDRICWIVDALADLFNCVATGDILREFGKANQDPYLHFYETFLAGYNPKLREERGVYYTPLPVVRFIVDAVDDILQNDFHIAKGLADNSKDGGFHKVYILEPAAGTGTFLVEVIENIYKRFANQQGMWRDYCKEHLLPRLNGFEILMAPYAMAHFKLDMKLKETGINTAELKDRFRVYLTNSLETSSDNNPILLMEKWLSDEADAANRVKRDAPVMIVLGNPPYSGESANRNCLADLLEDYKKEPGGTEKLKEKNSKWLNDDYVKFIRYGQSLVVKNGSGILAYVNNHSFLDNPTFRGMRWNLLQTFDAIYILDLHGNARKKEAAPGGEKDENVFDIQQGVSINIFVKTGKKKEGGRTNVLHYDLYGLRETKYTYLLENTLATVRWNELSPQAPQYFFVKKDFANYAEYEEGFSVRELFPVNGVGVTSAHDEFVIDVHKNVLLKRFLVFKDAPAITDYLHSNFNVKKKEGWNILAGHKNIQENDVEKYIMPIDYRPFDKRYIFYEDKIIWRSVKKIMRHYVYGGNYGLMVCRQQKTNGFYHCFVHTNIVESSFVSNKTSEIGYSFPLYLYPESGGLDSSALRRPNLKQTIVDDIANRLGLRFTDEKEDTENTFAPIDILDYIYAVLYSNNYRQKYKEFLKIDFPRIPYPQNAERFYKLAATGSILRKLHLMENVSPAMDIASFPVAGSNEIETAHYKDGKVFINKTQYFSDVPPDAWEYYIGGYQSAQKWLKDRRGLVLSFDDIEHYRKIISILVTTIKIQQQIDEVLAAP